MFKPIQFSVSCDNKGQKKRPVVLFLFFFFFFFFKILGLVVDFLLRLFKILKLCSEDKEAYFPFHQIVDGSQSTSLTSASSAKPSVWSIKVPIPRRFCVWVTEVILRILVFYLCWSWGWKELSLSMAAGPFLTGTMDRLCWRVWIWPGKSWVVLFLPWMGETLQRISVITL